MTEVIKQEHFYDIEVRPNEKKKYVGLIQSEYGGRFAFIDIEYENIPLLILTLQKLIDK